MLREVTVSCLNMDQRVRIAAALADGVSMRGVERMTNVTRKTVGSVLLSLGEGATLVHGARMNDLTADVLEFDEVWAYVGVKEGHRGEEHPEEFGDAYTFVALDATSRAVISHLTDKRTPAAADAFARDVRARVLGAPQITTDGLKSYIEAIERAFGSRVHYAQNLKTYAVDESGGASRDDVRYSRGRCVASQKRTISGTPDERHVTTAHIERNNLTTRMWCRRLTRLTTCFSRRLVFLRAAMAWHFAVYNFARICASLRVTPAMQLGVTDHVWSMEELVEASLSALGPGGSEGVALAVAPTAAMTPGVHRIAARRSAARRAKAARVIVPEAPPNEAPPNESPPSEAPDAERDVPEVMDEIAQVDTFPPPPDAASDFRWLW